MISLNLRHEKLLK